MRERVRLLHLGLACAVAAWVALGGGRVETAMATTTGSATFQGVATFSSGFPCAGCSGGGLAATAAVSLSGAPQAGLFYSATWPDPRTTPPGSVPTNLTAGFPYSASCEGSDSLPPVLGNAGGPFTLSGGMLVVNGTVWDNATLTGTFAWQWFGPTTATLSLWGLSITGGAGPSEVAVNVSLNNVVIGEGGVTFAWTSGPGTCLNPQVPTASAEVAGSVVQPT